MRPDDERFLETLRRAWGRPDSAPADRARFDAELRARLERPSRRPWLAAGLAAGLAAVVAIVMLPRDEAPAPAADPTPTWVSLAALGAGLPVATTGDEDGLGVAFVATDDAGADDDGLGTLVASAADDDLGTLLPSRLAGLARLLAPPARSAEELGDEP